MLDVDRHEDLPTRRTKNLNQESALEVADPSIGRFEDQGAAERTQNCGNLPGRWQRATTPAVDCGAPR